MGFLKFLLGGRDRSEPSEAPAEDNTTAVKLPPEVFSGMKVEVLSTTNSLLFVGKVAILDDGILEVRSENDGALPQAIYHQEIKLRGIQKNSQTITLRGNVCRSSIRFWHVENIEALQKSQENRSFFRQTAQIPAALFPSSRYREQDSHACTVLDISASGARLLSADQYPEGVMLRLDLRLIPEEDPFSISCQVCRVTPQKAGWEYGCKFVGLPEREQNRLLQTIFVLQRKTLQAKRD